MTEYYTEDEWEELYLRTTTWINCENNLSERSQTQNNSYSTSLLCKVQRQAELIYILEMPTQTVKLCAVLSRSVVSDFLQPHKLSDLATSLSLFTFMHWRRKWQRTLVFLPGESQGRGSLVGCRLWGCTESDTTEATQQQQLTSLSLAIDSVFPHIGKHGY